MSILDIRTDIVQEIKAIVVGDKSESYSNLVAIETCHCGRNSIVLSDSVADDYENALVIQDYEHAQNVIKGLQKAIELGWLK